MEIIILAIIAAATALVFGAVLTLNLLRQDEGDDTVQFIGRAIRQGAMAFLSREYTFLSMFVVVIFIVLLLFIDLGRTQQTLRPRREPCDSCHGHLLPGRCHWFGHGGLHWDEYCGKGEHPYGRKGPDRAEPRPSSCVQFRRRDGHFGGGHRDCSG